MAVRRIFRVAGVTFAPGYPQNLLDARPAVEEAAARGESLPVVLIRNPENQYDANAIEVHVPGAIGMVGHMPAHLAAIVAPKMDSGVIIAAEVQGIAIEAMHPDRPGIEIAAWVVDQEQAA